jgi:hypothetical protein
MEKLIVKMEETRCEHNPAWNRIFVKQRTAFEHLPGILSPGLRFLH